MLGSIIPIVAGAFVVGFRSNGQVGRGGDTDWPSFGRTAAEQHYSPLSQINRETVKNLGLAWYFDLPFGNSISSPVEADGVLYVATSYSIVRALDVRTGKQLWEYDPKVPEVAGQKLRNGWGIRGLAWWHGKVYVGTHDGRLIAIGARTGHPVWSVNTLPKDSVANITGPPRVFNGKVIIGSGGSDFGPVRGYVTTYNAETGKQLWRFYTVPGNPAKGFEDKAQAMAAKTWSGDWWKYGGGGSVWNAMTYDPETNTIFIGVGNGSPWNKRVRSPGTSDDLFVSSIVALDADTGKYKWHYQVNPGESWDYDAASDLPLATLKIDGKPRKVIMQAPKNGFFYVIDRVTGKVISAEPYAKVTWAKRIDLTTGRPVEIPAARYGNNTEFTLWPSAAGAHNWLPMSYSPATGLVYIPTLNFAATYNDRGIDAKTWQYRAGSIADHALNLGFASGSNVAGEAFLQAWDPVSQKIVWKVPTYGLWSGGTAATAGGLVFQGQANGLFQAYDDRTGKLLWSFDAGSAVIAPPITYEANGKQYVTVLTGMGLSFALLDSPPKKLPWQARTQARRVLTFVLGGGTKLTPPPPQEQVIAPDDPGYVPDLKRTATGVVLYHQHCVICHGVGAVAGGTAPDLRGSAAPQSAEVFKQIVRDGALVSQGMPQFNQLTDGERESIREYLRSRARDLAQGK